MIWDLNFQLIIKDAIYLTYILLCLVFRWIALVVLDCKGIVWTASTNITENIVKILLLEGFIRGIVCEIQFGVELNCWLFYIHLLV